MKYNAISLQRGAAVKKSGNYWQFMIDFDKPSASEGEVKFIEGKHAKKIIAVPERRTGIAV
ncbi:MULTISPECIES: leucyl-tRNA synthetase [Neisseria]|uniref:leucyl-tRNA synthetase n=1 Tax=Neisseria TaxID=482 RepID=UPI001F2531C8|nr:MULTISPECIES: leucyl-tRNA synthetase [Neisseria]